MLKTFSNEIFHKRPIFSSLSHNSLNRKEFAFILLIATLLEFVELMSLMLSGNLPKKFRNIFSLSLCHLHNYRPCEHLISNQITLCPPLHDSKDQLTLDTDSNDRNLKIFLVREEKKLR